MILRLAEHLERGRDQSVSAAELRGNGDGVDLHLKAAGDLTLPRWSVERYGDGEIFQRVFGRRLADRVAPRRRTGASLSKSG